MIRRLAVGWLLLLLIACASLPTSPQDAINLANVDITAAAEQITEYVTSGLLTPDEAQARLDKLKQYRDKLDKAQQSLNLGLTKLSLERTEVVDSLTKALRRELTRRTQ